MIYNKWLGVMEPEHVDWKTVAKYGAVVVIPLVMLLGGFALWSRTLHRQVAVRTADLTREIAERKHAEEELRLNQQQLVQADKLAALGVLVSGVAHEINNPTGLILLDVPILKRAHADSERILEQHYQASGDFIIGGIPYSEMRHEIPRVLDEMQDGAKRIKRIVNDLKDFAAGMIWLRSSGLISMASWRRRYDWLIRRFARRPTICRLSMPGKCHRSWATANG